MGAFCVFGISKSQCLAKASKQIDSIEISKAGTRARSITEWAALRNARAAELFETLDKAEKVSPEFDAPQFCRDWLSTNPSEVRLAKIMVRGGKVDAAGEPVLRKGVQVFGWIEFAEEGLLCEA